MIVKIGGIIVKKFSVVFIILFAIVISLSGCTDALGEQLIIGTWSTQTNILGVVTETEYTFNEDGTGSMSTVLGIGIATTYTIDEDKIIIITDTPTLQKTFTYTYEFVEDTLVLTDSDGSQTILTKS